MRPVAFCPTCLDGMPGRKHEYCSRTCRKIGRDFIRHRAQQTQRMDRAVARFMRERGYAQ